MGAKTDNDVMPNGLTAGQIRERDRERMEFIKRTVPNIHLIWECEIHEMLKKDPEMQAKFDEYIDLGPLDSKYFVKNCRIIKKKFSSIGIFRGKDGPIGTLCRSGARTNNRLC